MIVLNGKPAEGGGATVAELLDGLDLPHRGVAVAVDAEVVPRGEWGTHVVPDGARVEVVTAVQGG
ncbi:MAG TPA: sulfur carrier protein ThiS [Solirubrobacteraceae bacterium]|jgi:sulfur carrier protein|nr:sulfur carrier protein ThiS [Solirubrobacteraceae bacterium]